jgi:hypothetical protein
MEALYTKIQFVPRREHGVFCYNQEVAYVKKERKEAMAYRGGVGVFNPPKLRSFDKAEPNSQFRGKYTRNSLVFLFHHPS